MFFVVATSTGAAINGGVTGDQGQGVTDPTPCVQARSKVHKLRPRNKIFSIGACRQYPVLIYDCFKTDVNADIGHVNAFHDNMWGECKVQAGGTCVAGGFTSGVELHVNTHPGLQLICDLLVSSLITRISRQLTPPFF